MPESLTDDSSRTARPLPRIDTARVLANVELCREHARLTVQLAEFPPALPGQFVQLSPAEVEAMGSDSHARIGGSTMPLLPRAFSIGGLRRTSAGCEIDVIYRVVGVATRWMRSLVPGDRLTVLGPLGQEFPISKSKQTALLVIGGVGLPPLLWFAERLREMNKETIAFLGAQTADLVPLSLIADKAPATDAARGVLCTEEFARIGAPNVISTDDGSLGFFGNVVAALDAFAKAQKPDANETVVYTCGPERMMRATADWCQNAGMECFVCMERPMACGMGTCQSCIVTVSESQAASATRYALCCTEGPVFKANQIVWDDPALLNRQSK